MCTEFSAIADEFEQDLENIRSLVSAFDSPDKSSPGVRVAAANSATLLLAATFEEFVREMARCYAKFVVGSTDRVESLPQRFNETVWRRTMASLERIRFESQPAPQLILDAKAKFDAVFEFCSGDLDQDIYEVLIHNENNMRTGQINAVFKISGLQNVCLLLSDKQAISDTFSQQDSGQVHGLILSSLDNFFDRRNEITHSLNSTSSSGSIQINQDIDMFWAFGKSLCETLEAESQTI